MLPINSDLYDELARSERKYYWQAGKGLSAAFPEGALKISDGKGAALMQTSEGQANVFSPMGDWKDLVGSIESEYPDMVIGWYGLTGKDLEILADSSSSLDTLTLEAALDRPFSGPLEIKRRYALWQDLSGFDATLSEDKMMRKNLRRAERSGLEFREYNHSDREGVIELFRDWKEGLRRREKAFRSGDPFEFIDDSESFAYVAEKDGAIAALATGEIDGAYANMAYRFSDLKDRSSEFIDYHVACELKKRGVTRLDRGYKDDTWEYKKKLKPVADLMFGIEYENRPQQVSEYLSPIHLKRA